MMNELYNAMYDLFDSEYCCIEECVEDAADRNRVVNWIVRYDTEAQELYTVLVGTVLPVKDDLGKFLCSDSGRYVDFYFFSDKRDIRDVRREWFDVLRSELRGEEPEIDYDMVDAIKKAMGKDEVKILNIDGDGKATMYTV